MPEVIYPSVQMIHFCRGMHYLKIINIPIMDTQSDFITTENIIPGEINPGRNFITKELMRAIQVNNPGGEFELVTREIPEPKENEVLIKIQACGICHGDAVTKEGYFPGITYPKIPGHEVIGIIAKTGLNVEKSMFGKRVGVGWHAGHCFNCKACRRGNFWACENSLTTGISVDGGYAEYMIARSEVLESIPEELSSVAAAPLVCAGRTALGALQNSEAKGGDLIAIHGIGGLGHLAVQYSQRLGYNTVVISHSREKESLAYQLGANEFIDSEKQNAVDELKKMGGAKAILCFAPNAKAIASLVGGLARNGKMMIITAVNELVSINTGLLFGGASISGFAQGNIEDTLRFSVLSNVIPMVEVFPLEQAAVAYKKMMDSTVHFRAVLKMT
jgi:propanol-preferring alcohol dehydrogenase